MQTAKEHYDWCVMRAEKYLDRGDAKQGFNSFASDMREHKDTHIDVLLLCIGVLDISNGPEAVRRYIKGFNF